MTLATPRPILGGGAGATPGVLMFIGGLALVYWALSGWNLFGLGEGASGKRMFGGERGYLGTKDLADSAPRRAGAGFRVLR